MPEKPIIGRLLLNNQLFPPKYIPESPDLVVVSDSMWLLDEKPFNKITIAHRILSSNIYADQHKFHRISSMLGNSKPIQDSLKLLKSKKVSLINIFDPIDKPLLQIIERHARSLKLKLDIQDTPAFTETHEDLNSFLEQNPPKLSKGVRKYNHSSFYQWQRQRLNILWSKANKPLGGKISFDVENREPFTDSITKDPTIYKPSNTNSISKESILKVISFVEHTYPDNPGVLIKSSIQNINEAQNECISRITMYPLTNNEAKSRLSIFLKKMLPNFGKYEDAFQPGVSFGYHSVLSSSLNNGLITPNEILDAVQHLPKSTIKTHLASLEGFVRQVFGWRAYCRLVYRQEREIMLRSNFLSHRRTLPKSWFRYNPDKPLTGIEWLDNLLNDAQERAYAHHIVRLMVFSNWFLINQYNPRDVLNWFWSVVSIDAYEWVMVPNVLGMGQYADGGMMMNRPYVSASAYLEKMSNGKVSSKIWTSLFYVFLMKHEKTIGKMYAYARSMAYIRRVSPKQRKQWKDDVKKYWKGSKLEK